jgi:alanine-alpha-ketoisovalerate/valine-pyruvate aminotransferase
MIVKKQNTNRIEIDLTGPQGNAYFLMGTARKLGRQLCWDEDEIQTLLKQMTQGDYENLVNTFDKYFGDFVTLYR